MSYQTYGSRSDRYEKQRKNTKWMNRVILIATLLVAFLIGMFLLDDDDPDGDQDQIALDDTQDQQNEDETSEEPSSENNDSENNTDDEPVESPDSNDDSGNNSENDSVNENDSQDESNSEQPTSEEVKEVIDGNWQPYPTQQEEPHTIELSDGSQDRNEIEMAISQAVDIPRDQLIYWWLGSGGVPDQITGYVEDRSNNEYYRVYLQWIENQGWQPQKVEVLYENLGKQILEERQNN